MMMMISIEHRSAPQNTSVLRNITIRLPAADDIRRDKDYISKHGFGTYSEA